MCVRVVNADHRSLRVERGVAAVEIQREHELMRIRILISDT